jgi:hypothetical protein
LISWLFCMFKLFRERDAGRIECRFDTTAVNNSKDPTA